MQTACDNQHLYEDRPLHSLKGLQVLVVDDDIDSLDLIRFILEEYGVEVVTLASVSQALEVITQFKPDLLISDIAMPGRDGYSLVRQLRILESEQGGFLPAIALTACLIEEGRNLALASGFQLYLTKPIEPAELAIKVAGLSRLFTP